MSDSKLLGSVSKNNVSLKLYMDKFSNITDLLYIPDVVFWNEHFKVNEKFIRINLEDLQDDGGILIPAKYTEINNNNTINILEDFAIEFPIEANNKEVENKFFKLVRMDHPNYDINKVYLDIIEPIRSNFDDEDSYTIALDRYEINFSANIVNAIQYFLTNSNNIDGYAASTYSNTEPYEELSNIKTALDNKIVYAEIEYGGKVIVKSKASVIRDNKDVHDELTNIVEEMLTPEWDSIYDTCLELSNAFVFGKDIKLKDDSFNIGKNDKIEKPSDIDNLYK